MFPLITWKAERIPPGLIVPGEGNRKQVSSVYWMLLTALYKALEEKLEFRRKLSGLKEKGDKKILNLSTGKNQSSRLKTVRKSWGSVLNNKH